MKSKILCILLIIINISCSNRNQSINQLIEKIVEINNLKSPIILYDNGNCNVLKSKTINILSEQEIIKNKEDNFYGLFIIKQKNKTKVLLEHYKSGYDYITTFDKSDRIIENTFLQTKRGESKEFDLYNKIVNIKYPNGLIEEFDKLQKNDKFKNER